MSRICTLITLAILVAGCTRYGTNPPGKPFARKLRSDPNAMISPGPAATNSPLALTTPVPPASTQPPEPVALANGFLGPPRSGEVVPAGGILGKRSDATVAEEFPPRRRPTRTDPPAKQLPSPFAPKTPVADAPGSANAPKTPVADAPGSANAPKTPVADAPGSANAPKTPVADAPGSANAPGSAGSPVPPDAAWHIAQVKKLAEAAAAKWAKVNTYECVVTRRELAPNNKMNDDVVLYRFRKEPMSVYLRNLDEANQPREIIYNSGEDKIHAIVGKADATVLFKAGSKAPVVSPDFPMVKEKTRYSIREAGYGTPIARIASWVAKAENGTIPPSALTYLGEVQRKEYPYPLLGVQLKLRPGDEPNMPNGGLRQWFFDPNPNSPSYNWPVLIIATEPNGREVEYYLFEKFRLQVPLTDADFDPARLKKK